MPTVFLRRRLVWLAGVVIALTGGVPTGRSVDDGPTAARVRVERDILYATAGGEKLYLDLARPSGDGPFPCLVLMHGGAWKTGSRRDLSVGGRDPDGRPQPSWIELAAQNGYAAASVGYRLAPAHRFPAMIEDVRSAVRFLRANAKKYQIDPQRFAAGGFSAGAHLALLCGYCDRSAGFDVGEHLDQSGQVQCVINFFGPTDLSLYAATPAIEDGSLVPVFGKEVKTDPRVYKRASPLTYVSKACPPTLTLHGALDVVVPVKHAELLTRALKEAGVPTEAIIFPFGGHGGWGRRDMAKATAAVFRFLDEHLKGQTP